VALGLIVALVACGGETVLRVEVDLSNHAVPDAVDLIHLELRFDDDVLGRNFPLRSARQPVFELLPGPRTPSDLTLVGYAYLGTTLVSESPPVEATIRDGEETDVRLVMP
jgi:hypothetical protein